MIKVSINKNLMDNDVSLWIYDSRDNRTFNIASPIEIRFEHIVEMGETATPTLRINDVYAQEFLQALADGIASYGILPNKQSEAIGELNATKKHLEDFKRIVFNYLLKPNIIKIPTQEETNGK